MPRVIPEPSAIAAKRPAGMLGFHGVGGVPGLFLKVQRSANPERPTASWILRASVGDKLRDVGQGSDPGVQLAAARDLARVACEKMAQGVDPVAERRSCRSALAAERATALTFEEAAEACIKAKEPEWRNGKSPDQWRSSLKAYALPTMGKLLVRDVDMAHVLDVLEPIWSAKTETATRDRSRIEAVLVWATARELRNGPNPPRWRHHLDPLLAKPGKVRKVEHHRALPIKQAPMVMAQLREAAGTGARCLEWLILTAARSVEGRGARWPEVDPDAKTWTRPAGRMKGDREHVAPLSTAAVELLKCLPKSDDQELIFPSPGGVVLSDMTLGAVLFRLGVDSTAHGWRSTFRMWAANKTNFPREVAEHALAHKLPDKVEAAYQRANLLPKRATLMQSWADYLAKAPAKVVDIPKRAKRAAA